MDFPTIILLRWVSRCLCTVRVERSAAACIVASIHLPSLPSWRFRMRIVLWFIYPSTRRIHSLLMPLISWIRYCTFSITPNLLFLRYIPNDEELQVISTIPSISNEKSHDVHSMSCPPSLEVPTPSNVSDVDINTLLYNRSLQGYGSDVWTIDLFQLFSVIRISLF